MLAQREPKQPKPPSVNWPLGWFHLCVFFSKQEAHLQKMLPLQTYTRLFTYRWNPFWFVHTLVWTHVKHKKDCFEPLRLSLTGEGRELVQKNIFINNYKLTKYGFNSVALHSNHVTRHRHSFCFWLRTSGLSLLCFLYILEYSRLFPISIKIIIHPQ